MPRKAGYLWLKEQFQIETLDYWVTSYVLDKGSQRTELQDGYKKEFYRVNAWPGDAWHDHLEFALKREGLHLELLRKLMPLLQPEILEAYISSTPTGKYARITWFIYESFTNQRLPIADLTGGNYVPLADPEIYITATPEKISRQRIDMNLLGNIHFSPILRRTALDLGKRNADLKSLCEETVTNFPETLYSRAINYLYVKESKSSYAIERETATASRTRNFMQLLESVWAEDFLTKALLIKLQNTIVDERFKNDDYRSSIDEQIYVGESITPQYEKVHYIGPKPDDVDYFMSEFIGVSKQLLFDVKLADIAVTAIISYLFNFIHPFSDGNGRIHRFLMHYVLANRGFGPKGIILPISAVILNKMKDYDNSLECFSRKLMEKIDYELDERLRLIVYNETKDFYRYIDFTLIVEIFYNFAEETIRTELPAEIDYLRNHDLARSKMREVVDLPDRIAELFLLICHQNHGKLSNRKRDLPEFSKLSDEEISELEKIYHESLIGGK